jgi:hypothetical protein
MKNHIAIAALIVLSMAFASGANNFKAGILGSLVLPIGDFADDNNFDLDGFSHIGLAGGMEFMLEVGHPMLHWTSGAMVTLCFFDEDEAADRFGLADDIDGGHYLGFPLLTGMRVDIPVNAPVVPFAQAQIGANILKQLDADVRAFGVDAELDFDAAVSFAFSAVAGILISDALSLSFRLLWCSEPEIDYTVSSNVTSYTYSAERDFSATMILICAGYEF